MLIFVEFHQLLQFPVANVTVGPLGKFNDLRGHVDEDHDQRRDDDEKYRDRHEQRDRIIPFGEHFSEFRVERVKREREDGRPKNNPSSHRLILTRAYFRPPCPLYDDV